jgi:hypothetical protein
MAIGSSLLTFKGRVSRANLIMLPLIVGLELARPRDLHGWDRCLLSGVVQTRFAPGETFGP